MPRLIIDNQEIEVPPGTKIIEAAEKLGIMIPRFCYHPALGSVGACRVCAVKFLQGPFKGIQMSCMIEAKDDMVVSTTDPEAVEFRRFVIEWLMLHHPHDCPVCDEGGHCLLQDMTISGGHGVRRYRGKKRTYPDQDLGPLVQHEMNRCIHCYRCSRFYQEFAGYRDLGVLQIANRTYFGRFAPGVLESPFAGNLSDICPTGVYTDKPSRYKGRRWDYERSPAICINCSLGCRTVVSARYREIVRQEAHFNRLVNGYFICDRGRFGFYYCEDARRPRRARVDDRPEALSAAVRAAATELEAVCARHGPAAVAAVGGLRSPLATQAMLHRICRERNWQGPAFFPDPATSARIRAAAERLAPGLALSLREIEQADAVLVVGADPVNEAPMLALALRQAWRSGAEAAVIDPRPVALPLAFTRVPTRPDEIGRVLGALCRQSVAPAAARSLGSAAIGFYDALESLPPLAPSLSEKLIPIANRLRASRRPAIICGTDIAANGLPDLAADLALLLQAAGKKSGLFYVMPGAGAFSAAVMNHCALTQLLTEIENDRLRALLVVESDPLYGFYDRQRLERALDKLELLVVIDYLESEISRSAHIRLPSATLYETGGHFVNQEGRVQRSPAAYHGGPSVLQTGGGDHPPRAFASDIPGGGQWAAWQILAALAGLEGPGSLDEVFRTLVETVPAFRPLSRLDDLPDEGVRLVLATDAPRHFDPARLSSDRRRLQDLDLVFTEWTFGTEELSVRSDCLAAVTPEPCVFMHPADAGPLGLGDGARVRIETASGRLTLPVRVVDHMAEGVVVVPRHHLVNWRIFESGSPTIPRDRLLVTEGEALSKG